MFKSQIELFEELNARLKEINEQLTLICVGGFVLNYYNLRMTTDIDAFYNETTEIRNIIARIGDEHELNTDELWINNSVQNMNLTPPKEICKTIHSYSNLEVLIPPLEYVAGMKLSSAREIDIQDVGHIIKYLGFKDIDEFNTSLEEYNFGTFDESLVIEAFGNAYGEDWLVNYYTQNEKKIIERLDNSSYMYKSSKLGNPPKKERNIEPDILCSTLTPNGKALCAADQCFINIYNSSLKETASHETAVLEASKRLLEKGYSENFVAIIINKTCPLIKENNKFTGNIIEKCREQLKVQKERKEQLKHDKKG